MLTDFFDTMGTVTGVAAEAGLADEDGSVPGVGRVLLVDSLAAVAGGAAGISSNTTYIESAAGVAEGGRTGFTSVVTGVLFLLAIFLAPLAGDRARASATAPALVLVGYLMFTLVKDITSTDVEEGLPALLTMILMPLTYDITVGIGAGFITLGPDQGRPRQVAEVHPLMWVVSVAFVVYFAPGLDHRRSCPKLSRRSDRPARRPGRPAGAPRSIPVPSRRDVRTDRAARRAARHQRPAARRRARSPSPPTSWPARASRRPSRPASPTSWSTSPSRARPRYPIDPGDQRGDRGRRRLVQRRHRPRVDGLLGPRPAARGDPGDGRPRRADRPADASTTARSRASGRSSSRRSARYLDDPAEYCQILFQRRCSATGRWAARSAATRPTSGRLPDAADPRLLGGRRYRPANTVVAVAGDLDHDEAVGLVDRRLRDAATASIPRLRRRRPTLPAGPRVMLGAARARPRPSSCVGVPALPRDHPDSVDAGGPQRASSATG